MKSDWKQKAKMGEMVPAKMRFTYVVLPVYFLSHDLEEYKDFVQTNIYIYIEFTSIVDLYQVNSSSPKYTQKT